MPKSTSAAALPASMPGNQASRIAGDFAATSVNVSGRPLNKTTTNGLPVAAMSSNVPALSSNAFPPPASSAGVPISATVRPSSSATSANASAVPTADAAMMLWPQACPMPGSASYSAQMPTTSGPLP